MSCWGAQSSMLISAFAWGYSATIFPSHFEMLMRFHSTICSPSHWSLNHFNAYRCLCNQEEAEYHNDYGVAGYSGDNGLATVARFNRTDGIAIGASGNMYVSDFYYNVIRMITKSTGIITMVAGTGHHQSFGYNFYYAGDGYPATNATLNGPAGIAVDA